MPDSFEKDRSLLKTAIVAAPLVAGAGIGVRSMLRTGVAAPRASSVSKAMATLKQTYGAQAWEPAIERHLRFIRDTETAAWMRGKGAVAAQEAWGMAVEGADPMARQQLMGFAKNIRAMPPEQVFSAIENTMTQQKSQLAETVYRRFRRNLEALRAQEAIGGGAFIPYVAPSGVVGEPIPMRPPKFLAESMARIEGKLGISAGASSALWYTRPGWGTAEGGLGMFNVTFPTKAGPATMMVPMEVGGTLVAGTTQKAKYISPEQWIADPKGNIVAKMKRHEFMMHEFERTIVPEIQSGKLADEHQVRRAVKKLEQRVIFQLENVRNPPPGARTGAQIAYEQSRGQQVDVLIRESAETGYRKGTEDELARVLRNNPELYGGTGGAGAAKGRFQRMNLAGLYTAGELAEHSRQLQQGIRHYELTPAARAAMGLEAGFSHEAMGEILKDPTMSRYARYQTYESAKMAEFEPLLRRPNLRTLYVHPDVLELHNVREGEALARRSLTQKLEFQANTSQKLATLRKDLEGALLAGKPVDIKPGSVIGWTESKVPYVMTKEMRGLSAVEHQGEYMLHYMDVRRLENNTKFFEDMKALMRLQDDQKFERTARAMTKGQVHAAEIDLIVSLKELSKDPRKHTQQIISGLGEVLHRRGVVPGSLAEQYLLNPEVTARGWMERATIKGVPSQKRFVEEAMAFATKGVGLQAAEFGEVFGNVPYVMGLDAAETGRMLSRAATGMSDGLVAGYAGTFSGRWASGVGKYAYFQPAAAGGAGGMGSIEPRVLDILRGPAWGKEGEELAEDIMRRLEYTNPERLAVHRELTRTFESIIGKAKPGVGAATWKAAEGYTYGGFGDFVKAGGGWIDPGKGMKSVYVPGAEAIQAMREFKIGNQMVTAQLADYYHDIARSAAGMHGLPSETITPAEYTRQLERHGQGLWKHWAPGAKGIGRVAGGKFIGSRFLTGVSEAGGFRGVTGAVGKMDPFVAGVSEKYFKQMIADMTQSGMYEAASLERMSERFVAGEEIGGVIMRHPTIGAFSAQPMRFARIPDAAMGRAEIVLPEVNVRARMQGIGKDYKLTLGPLIGLAGDKDADMYSAMLVKPDSEKAIRKMTTAADSEFIHRYTQHQVRYQLLKEKAAPPAAGMTIREKMIADVRKLGTTERYVPTLSTELSRTRRALMAAGGAKSANAWTMLEWLEQTPIGAKHLSALQMEAGGLESLMGEIQSAFVVGGREGERRLETVVRGIIRADEAAGELLTGGVTLESRTAREISGVVGAKIDPRVSGLEVTRTVKELMLARARYTEEGGRFADLAVGGTRGPRIPEYERMLESAASITRKPPGAFASVSQATTAAKNMAGRLGRGMIRNYKPLALGLAGSMILATALSSPKDSIGPGAQFRDIKLKMNRSKAAGRMKKEDVMPPQQALGTPTAPNMLRSPRTMITSSTPSRQVSVRARANYMVNTRDLSEQLSRAGGPARTSVSIRDNRGSLNPHVIANKLA